MPVVSFFPNESEFFNLKYFALGKASLFIIVFALLILIGAIIGWYYINRLIIITKVQNQKIQPIAKRKKKKEAEKKTFDFIKTNQNFEYKFIWSNNILGIDNKEKYYTFKILSTGVLLLVGIEIIYLYELSIIEMLICTVFLLILGWKLIDIILWRERKDREQSIKENMPMLLISFDNYSKAGLFFDDVLQIVPQFLSGPLRKEFARFSVSYMVSKDFEKSLAEFSKRLGCDDGEEIELKLRQVYYSGVYEDMLTNEKELIEKKVINDLKKESGKYELYMAIAMCLMIINIFILTVIPLIGIASEGLMGII